MNNWQNLTISDLCSNVYSGGTPSKKHPEYYTDGKIPWLNTGEIVFKNIYKTQLFINELGYKNSSAKWVPENSVIVAMYGATAGRSAINKIPLTTNQACCNLIVNPEKADYRYVYNYLKKSFKHLASLANGGAQQNLNSGHIKDYPILVPSLDEQKRIVDIISMFDEKIEANERINQTILEYCYALYCEICEDAPLCELSNLIVETESGSRPKGGAETSGIPSIGAEKIEQFGIYDYSSEKYINAEFYNKMKRGRVLSGDVLLYKDGAYTGKVSLALNGFPHEQCAVNEHVFILRTNRKSKQFFLYFTLSNPLVRKSLFSLASSKAAQPGLNQGELISVKAPIPNDSKIEKFEKIVKPFMEKIANNSLENRHLSDMRDLVFDRIISGDFDYNEMHEEMF